MDERRVYIVGRSGSGKSTLLQMLAEAPPPGRRGLLLDLKGDPLEDGGLYQTSRTFLRVPPPSSLHTAEGPWFEFVGEWAAQVYQDGRTFLLVDEVSLCIRGNKPPPELVRLLILGRSRKIGWALATQRPVSVPPPVWAQANEFAVFSLGHPRDLEVARDMGLTRDQVEQLPSLQWGEYFHVVPGLRTHLHRGATQQCAAAEF